MKPVGVAILGAGNIARTMAQTITRMNTVQPLGVASRDHKRAEVFARQFNLGHAWASYEEMLADDRVELVYIATPHSHHAQQMLQCLRAGKHVLCEKAFTVNADQAEEVLQFAQERKLLVVEAIWPRYMPMAETLQEFVSSGRIGKVTTLSGGLGYSVWAKERLRDPMLAGGALLDIGIYPLTFASIVFGDDILDVQSTAVMSSDGVDMQNSIIITYRDGRVANLFSSAIGASDRRGVLCGDKGYAVVGNINNYEYLIAYDLSHNEIYRTERPVQITGFEYQVQAAVDAIHAGAIECAQMPHERILGMMKLMDRIREIWGMRYPCE